MLPLPIWFLTALPSCHSSVWSLRVAHHLACHTSIRRLQHIFRHKPCFWKISFEFICISVSFESSALVLSVFNSFIELSSIRNLFKLMEVLPPHTPFANTDFAPRASSVACQCSNRSAPELLHDKLYSVWMTESFS